MQYVEILYKDVLSMNEGSDPPIPYQIIILPDDLKEIWIKDKYPIPKKSKTYLL